MKAATSLTAAVVVALAAALVVVGCGGDGGSGGRDGVSVPLRTTIAVSPFAVDQLTIATTAWGDRIGVDGPTARVQRPDGSSEAVSVSVDAATGTVTLGHADVVVSPGVEATAQSVSPADVRVLATVTEGGPGRIEGVVLRAVDPGDTFDISGATARVQRPDDASAPVGMSINAEQNEVTLGPFSVEPSSGTSRYWQPNSLTIDGPVFVTDGPTGSSTQIGHLLFSFAVEEDGDVVAPATIEAAIPTIGVPDDRRVVVAGLRPYHDYVWVAVREQSGARMYSKTYMADETGQAVIPDTQGQISAEGLSGPDSVLELWFVSWDKSPPLPVSPPYRGDGPIPDWAALNTLTLAGGVRVTSGVTRRTIEIGRVRFGFHVMADGSVVAPATIDWSVPADDTPGKHAVRISGLQAGDTAQMRVAGQQGPPVLSRPCNADSGGLARLTDALTGVTASALSGPDSTVSFFFARPPN